MKLTRTFQPNDAHRYTLAPGVMVQSAKFGRCQVDIWQEAEPGPIWRGEPKRVVGYGARRLWRFVVHGQMSGSTTTEAAARSEGERRAREVGSHSSPPLYALGAAGEAAEREAFAAYLADIDTRFPVAA